MCVGSPTAGAWSSFQRRPDDEFETDSVVEGAAACIQRMQKALTLMNLQLHNVISDVTGVTGMLILRDIVAGMTDPAVLARHRHPQCRASEAEIAASLTGHYRDEHLFVLRQARFRSAASCGFCVSTCRSRLLNLDTGPPSHLICRHIGQNRHRDQASDVLVADR